MFWGFGSTKMEKVFSFSLSEAAQEYLRNEVKRSTVRSPVVYLLRARNLDQVTPEADRNVVGAPNQGHSKELVTRQNTLGPPHLIPCIYSKWHFLGLFMVRISGIV